MLTGWFMILRVSRRRRLSGNDILNVSENKYKPVDFAKLMNRLAYVVCEQKEENAMDNTINNGLLRQIRGYMYAEEHKKPLAASYHKVVLHVHTPASYDYKMLSENPHSESRTTPYTKEELFDYGVNNGYWDETYNIEQNSELYPQ